MIRNTVILLILLTNSALSQTNTGKPGFYPLTVRSCPSYYFDEEGIVDNICDSLIFSDPYTFYRELDTFLMENKPCDTTFDRSSDFLRFDIQTVNRHDSLTVSDWEFEYFCYNNRIYRFTRRFLRTVVQYIPHSHQGYYKLLNSP